MCDDEVMKRPKHDSFAISMSKRLWHVRLVILILFTDPIDLELMICKTLKEKYGRRL